jgi:hypothetical protein
MNPAVPDGAPPLHFNYLKTSSQASQEPVTDASFTSINFMIFVRTISVHFRFNRAINLSIFPIGLKSNGDIKPCRKFRNHKLWQTDPDTKMLISGTIRASLNMRRSTIHMSRVFHISGKKGICRQVLSVIPAVPDSGFFSGFYHV